MREEEEHLHDQWEAVAKQREIHATLLSSLNAACKEANSGQAYKESVKSTRKKSDIGDGDGPVGKRVKFDADTIWCELFAEWR